MRRFLVFAASIAMASGSVPGQAKKDDIRLDLGLMKQEREVHAVTEGKLAHHLIRHSLGLKIDASEYVELTESEAQLSPAVARQALTDVRRDLRRRAAQLKRVTAELRNGANPIERVGTGGANPGMAPELSTGPRREGLGDHRPVIPADPVVPIETRDSVDPGKVAGIIKGSSDASVVGRALFRAGRFAVALAELAPAEAEKEADLGDLFYLARAHEELHNIDKDAASAARVAATRVRVAADKAQAEADKIRGRRRHLRSTGGTLESVAEFDRQMAVVKSASQEEAAFTAEFRAKRKVAAHHYERAYSIFILIEGRDVEKTSDAKEVPGKWAEAARSARNMMKWIETSRDWTPPKVKWEVK